jgi:hypothetical protein
MWIGPNDFVVTYDTWTWDMFILLGGNLAGGPLQEAWRPARTGAPKWGFAYDYSQRTGKLAFHACEANWTPSGDEYVVDPADWQCVPLWSDGDNNHEDGSPRWSARGDRIAWGHGVEPGVAPTHWIVGIIDYGVPGATPRWIGSPAQRAFIQDWTDDDNLMVLDVTGGGNRLYVFDDRGNLLRQISCPREVRHARWKK